MAINFPDSPVTNQYFTSGGTTWVYDGSTWNLYEPGFSIYQSASPTATVSGQLWLDSDDDTLYAWDGSSWVNLLSQVDSLSSRLDSVEAIAMLGL